MTAEIRQFMDSAVMAEAKAIVEARAQGYESGYRVGYRFGFAVGVVVMLAFYILINLIGKVL